MRRFCVATACFTCALSVGVVSGETAGGFVPYFPNEPRALYAPEAMDETTRLWVNYSHRTALHGDLSSAIEQMQIAANTLLRRRNDDFELWDNLAELYCAKANRERDPKRAAAARTNGLAMLAEFRCAAKVFSGSEYDMSCKTKRGFVPNPAFTPLCYQLFCTDGERDKGEVGNYPEGESEPAPDPYVLFLAKFRADAANLSAIEQVCRVKTRGP
ncbi:MAG: hypothetical protein ACREXT_07495 [Gammaproteobacteria bacterium]